MRTSAWNGSGAAREVAHLLNAKPVWCWELVRGNQDVVTLANADTQRRSLIGDDGNEVSRYDREVVVVQRDDEKA